MKFHSSVVFVKNIEKSKDFYIRLLNQEIEHDFGKNVILKGGLTLWELNDEHMIPRQLETTGCSNRFELYFESGRIEESCELLKAEGVEFLHESHEEPWGQRTIRFFDPDHHLVEVGEPLEVFVNNMFRNGMSAEEISQKSGIRIETVNQMINR